MPSRMKLRPVVAALLAASLATTVLMAGCAPSSRLGMVEDPATGLMYGSVIEGSLFVDPSQFRNRTIKVSSRDTSGDTAYDLGQLVGRLRSAYAAKGYQPTDGDSFGIRVDVNVEYSGQASQSLMTEFAFLGGAAGGVAGARADSDAAIAGGVVAGATLGAILGSHITDQTYVVIATISVGVTDRDAGATNKTIVFSDSARREEKKQSDFRPFGRSWSSRVAAYAGGRNVPQSAIAGEVRQRLIRIVSDVI